MLFKQFENASLRDGLDTPVLDISFFFLRHFRYMGLTPNFSTTSTIYPGMCVPNFTLLPRYSFALRRYCEEENGDKNMPPATGGRRGGPAAGG